MNTTQRNYLRKRIQETLQTEITAFEKAWQKKHRTPGKRLTKLERLQLIIKGKVSMRTLKEIKADFSQYQWDDVHVLYDFTALEWPEGIRFEEERDAIIQQMREAGQRTEDVVMLGDAEGAVDKLAEFATTLKALAKVA